MLTRRDFFKNTGQGLAFSFFDHHFCPEKGDDNQKSSLNAALSGYKIDEESYCIDRLLIGVGTKTLVLRDFIKKWKIVYPWDFRDSEKWTLPKTTLKRVHRRQKIEFLEVPKSFYYEDALEEYFIMKDRGVEDISAVDIVERYLITHIEKKRGFPLRDENDLIKIEKKLILIIFQMDSIVERKIAFAIAKYANWIGFRSIVGISNAYMDLKENPDDHQSEEQDWYFDTTIVPPNNLYKASNDFSLRIPPVNDSFYLNAIRGLFGLTIPGLFTGINIDDLISSIGDMGKVCFTGTGKGSGHARIIKAANAALANLKMDKLPSKIDIANLIVLMEGIPWGPKGIHLSECSDCLDYIKLKEARMNQINVNEARMNQINVNEARMNQGRLLMGMPLTVRDADEEEVRVTLFINGGKGRGENDAKKVMKTLDFDFGDIGLKIGDEITFKKNKMRFIVASGDGTPGNGGTFVTGGGRFFNVLFTLRRITHMLLRNGFYDVVDIYELWEYKGITLRRMFEMKQTLLIKRVDMKRLFYNSHTKEL